MSLWAEMPGCSSEGSGAPWTLRRIQVCPFQLVNILVIFTTLILQMRMLWVRNIELFHYDSY